MADFGFISSDKEKKKIISVFYSISSIRYVGEFSVEHSSQFISHIQRPIKGFTFRKQPWFYAYQIWMAD